MSGREAPEVSGKQESLERNAKKHLQLRVDWARAIAGAQGVEMTDVLADSTDLYARIFGRRIPVEEVSADPQWQAFVEQVRQGADPVDVAYRLREDRKKTEIAQGSEEREFFGPFRYDYQPEFHGVNVHFGSMGWDDDERDAPVQFTKDIKSALSDMFRAIKKRHPEARVVGGASWLFTRLLQSKQYRKAMYEVLPKSFVDSADAQDNKGQGGGLWGQFVDNRGKFHDKRAAQFRERMHNPSIMEKGPYRMAFPIQATQLEAPIEDFYTFYGVE